MFEQRPRRMGFPKQPICPEMDIARAIWQAGKTESRKSWPTLLVYKSSSNGVRHGELVDKIQVIQPAVGVDNQ